MTERAAALLWVDENQFGRTDLSADQRAAIAARVLRRGKNLFGRHWTERPSNPQVPLPDGHPWPRAFAVEAVADQVGVSTYRVRATAKLADSAPELLEAAAAGRLVLQNATSEVVAHRRRAEREAIAGRVKRLPPDIRTGDFRR